MMIRSMTGFGRGRAEADGYLIEAEVRSVNHRFLDLSLRLPEVLGQNENRLSAIVSEYAQRGKVDLVVTMQHRDARSGGCQVECDEVLVDEYIRLAKRLAGAREGISAQRVCEQLLVELLLRRDVVQVAAAQSSADLSPVCEQAVRQALAGLVAMREAEGEKLGKILDGYLADLEQVVERIEATVKANAGESRARLERRLQSLLGGNVVAEERLAQEVAILADRVDVSEEVARLQTHVGHFSGYLRGEGAGRKCDFLVQEMFRELNTCGSKAQQAQVSALCVEGKYTLEKLREQLQNIE